MSNTELTAFCERHGIDANKLWSLACEGGPWRSYLWEVGLSNEAENEASELLGEALRAKWVAERAQAAAPIEIAEPDTPEQVASEPDLTMTLPEVQALVAAVRADEQAAGAKAAQDSRGASPTANQGQVGRTEPGSAWAAWEVDAEARREAHAAERAAMIAAGTYQSEGLPIRMTLAETNGYGGAVVESKPDGAAAWANVINRMKGNGR